MYGYTATLDHMEHDARKSGLGKKKWIIIALLGIIIAIAIIIFVWLKSIAIKNKRYVSQNVANGFDTLHPFFISFDHKKIRAPITRLMSNNNFYKRSEHPSTVLLPTHRVKNGAKQLSQDDSQQETTISNEFLVIGFDIHNVKIGDIILTKYIADKKDRNYNAENTKNLFPKRYQQDYLDGWKKSRRAFSSLDGGIMSFASKMTRPAMYVHHFLGDTIPSHSCIVGEILPKEEGDDAKSIFQRVIVYDYISSEGLVKMPMALFLERNPSTKFDLYYIRNNVVPQTDLSPCMSKNIQGSVYNNMSYYFDRDQSPIYINVPQYIGRDRIHTICLNSHLLPSAKSIFKKYVAQWNGIDNKHFSCSSVTYAMLELLNSVVSFKQDDIVKDENTTKRIDLLQVKDDNRGRCTTRITSPQQIVPSDFARIDFQWSIGVQVIYASQLHFVKILNK